MHCDRCKQRPKRPKPFSTETPLATEVPGLEKVLVYFKKRESLHVVENVKTSK